MVILCSKIVNEVVSDLLSMFLCIQGDYIGSLPISQLKEMYSCMSSLHGCGTELIVYCSVSVIVYCSVSLNGMHSVYIHWLGVKGGSDSIVNSI